MGSSSDPESDSDSETDSESEFDGSLKDYKPQTSSSESLDGYEDEHLAAEVKELGETEELNDQDDRASVRGHDNDFPGASARTNQVRMRSRFILDVGLHLCM